MNSLPASGPEWACALKSGNLSPTCGPDGKSPANSVTASRSTGNLREPPILLILFEDNEYLASRRQVASVATVHRVFFLQLIFDVRPPANTIADQLQQRQVTYPHANRERTQ